MAILRQRLPAGAVPGGSGTSERCPTGVNADVKKKKKQKRSSPMSRIGTLVYGTSSRWSRKARICPALIAEYNLDVVGRQETRRALEGHIAEAIGGYDFLSFLSIRCVTPHNRVKPLGFSAPCTSVYYILLQVQKTDDNGQDLGLDFIRAHQAPCIGAVLPHDCSIDYLVCTRYHVRWCRTQNLPDWFLYGTPKGVGTLPDWCE